MTKYGHIATYLFCSLSIPLMFKGINNPSTIPSHRALSLKLCMCVYPATTVSIFVEGDARRVDGWLGRGRQGTVAGMLGKSNEAVCLSWQSWLL